MAAHPPVDLDRTRVLECHTDPVLAPYELTVTGVYFERFWLPLVGPSVTALLRHIAGHHDEAATLRQVGEALGLGAEHITRCVERSQRFAMIELTSSRLLGLRFVAPLTARQVAKLPRWLAAQHPASPPMRRIAATSSAR
jgi:hypothetical protein